MRWLFHRVVRRWGVLYHSAVRRWECPVLSHRAQCAGWIRRCGFPSRCARMGCWSVFPLHRAVRRWECPSCLTPRSAQGGSGGAAFPRAVRGWGVGPFLFSPPPRCAQVGVSVRSHRCAVRRVDQAWSADAPKKRSDAFANTLKVSGGHERGATCARSADAPTAFPRAVRGWGVGPFLCSLHRAVRRWECPSGLTAARCAGWIRRGVLMLQRNAQTLPQTL